MGKAAVELGGLAGRGTQPGKQAVDKDRYDLHLQGPQTMLLPSQCREGPLHRPPSAGTAAVFASPSRNRASPSVAQPRHVLSCQRESIGGPPSRAFVHHGCPINVRRASQALCPDCVQSSQAPFPPLHSDTAAATAGAAHDARSTLPWVEKYRPESLDDLIAHEDIIATSECCVAATLVWSKPAAASCPLCPQSTR